jgi:hypothetical protein
MPLLGNRRALLEPPFSLRKVWANNAAGLWYGTGLTEGDQDSTGTTALTAPGVGTADCPQGYVTDKSGNGLHGIQATAAARPTYSARKNLLVQTEAWNNAAWVKSSGSVVVTEGAAVAPDGTTTAARMKNTAAAACSLYQTINSPTSNTLRVTAKADGKNWLWFIDRTGGSGGAWFNLATGAVGTVLVGHTATIEDAGSGYYTCTIKSAAGTYTYFQVGISDADNTLVSTAHASNGVLLWHPQAELGSTATTYQSITDASNYATSGFPTFRRFDGIDDGHATAAFAAGTLTSNMDCFMVVKRNSADRTFLVHQGPGTGPVIGGIEAAGGAAATSGSATHYVDGVVVPGGTATTRGQLHTAMPVGQWHVLEVRNVDLSAVTSLQFGSYAASYFLNGNIGEVILCPAQTDAMRAKIRRYLGNTVGLSL